MHFHSFLALCLAPLISAKTLEIYIKNSGGGVLDLGGVVDWSDSGVAVRIDGGAWTSIENEKSTYTCAYVCKDNKMSPAYTLGALRGTQFRICQSISTCTPGDKFDCTIDYNGTKKTFKSTKDSSFIGVARSITTYCGGKFENV